MKPFLPLILGAALLAACGSAPSSGGSTRPELPTGIEVRFPAQASAAYLSLLTETGDSVYQLSVPAGKSSVEVDSTKWAAQSANAVDIMNFIPAGAVVAPMAPTRSPGGLKVNLLYWVLWQDANSNGQRDAGETLDLMTHDRVAYASEGVTVEFTHQNIDQRWKLAQGWSRAEHYVYLPRGLTTYQRLFQSAAVQRYELHVPTPLTSQ